MRGQQEDDSVEQGQGQHGHNAVDDVEQPSPGEGDAEAEAATRSEQLRHHERRVLQDVLHAQDSPPTVRLTTIVTTPRTTTTIAISWLSTPCQPLTSGPTTPASILLSQYTVISLLSCLKLQPGSGERVCVAVCVGVLLVRGRFVAALLTMCGSVAGAWQICGSIADDVWECCWCLADLWQHC